MPINGYFSWIFDQFFTFFIDCGHIHVPKGTWCWVFFYFGVHCSWLGMAQKRFILDQNWPNMAGLSTFQSGPKGTKVVNSSVFDHFLPFWALLDSFRLFQTKIAFLLLSTSAKPEINIKNLLYPFGAKKSFLSKMVQKGPDGPKMGPKWSKTFRLTILVPFGPFWTTLECWQACHVWPFLVQNGPFLGHPQSWTVDPRVKKRLIIMSPMCGLLVEPQICPFGT